MTSLREEPIAGCSGGEGFHKVHAERNPESNWAVDLDKLLEDYLAKICAGNIPDDEDESSIRVNFAEAALLLQGSVQVYSRKVEYLYSLVLHTLEFISNQRQQKQDESTQVQPEGSGLCSASDEDDDPFWISDEVPVDPKNALDNSNDMDAPPSYFMKPPANLVVLEGDCLEASDAAGELESYLLASSDLYRDFILLDSCDAATVNAYLKADNAIGKGQSAAKKVDSIRKSFQSPTGHSVGGLPKSSTGKNRNNLEQSSHVDWSSGVGKCDMGPDPPVTNDFTSSHCEFGMDSVDPGPADFFSDDDDNNEDPWKPLNPHEPGNLKVKPFKRVKAIRKPIFSSSRKISMMADFPLARRHGTISLEFTDIWEKQNANPGRQHEAQSPPLFEKLRQSLLDGVRENPSILGNVGEINEDREYDDGVPESTAPDEDMPGNMHMDEMEEDVPLWGKHDNDVPLETDEAFGNEVPMSSASLEDLCRSHLDALLKSVAETEKQTELAARVSSWKQKIEQNLEEQDSRPPFDIHEYSDKIMAKLSVKVDEGNAMSFAEIVQGKEKHDVARTFSALLQLVNNGDVDLERGEFSESVCYTAVNPFHVRLISNNMRQRGILLRSAKKRAKSPIEQAQKGGKSKHVRRRDKSPADSPLRRVSMGLSSQPNGMFPVKLGKVSGVRCTPEVKRRRRSRYAEPVNLHSAS